LKITYKEIWKISLPIIAGLIAQNVMIVIDTAFLGRVGEVGLGAGAIGGLFYLAVVMLGIGFGTGAQIMMGRRNGEKNFHQIGFIMDHSFYFLFFLALLLFILMLLLSPLFLQYTVSSNAIYEASSQFMKYRMWGIFFAFVNVAFTSFYIGITKTRVLTISTTLLSLVNIILDYCLIFGHWGFPEMGVGGAALASTIAEASASIFFIFYTYNFIDIKKYNLFGFLKYNKVMLKSILNISAPVMAQYFISFSAWFSFFMMIEHMGQHALAISNIARSVYILLMIPIWGLSSATNTLVSNLIGAGRSYKVIPLIKKVIVISLLCTFVVILLMLAFIRPLLSVYTKDTLLITDTIPALYVIAVALILFSVSMIIFNGVSGSGNTKSSFRIEVVTILAYLLSTFIFSRILHSKVQMVWCAEWVYMIVMGTLSVIYLKTKDWKSTII